MSELEVPASKAREFEAEFKSSEPQTTKKAAMRKRKSKPLQKSNCVYHFFEGFDILGQMGFRYAETLLKTVVVKEITLSCPLYLLNDNKFNIL